MVNPDYERIEHGDVLAVTGLRDALADGDTVEVANTTKGATFTARHELSPRQVERILAGGIIAYTVPGGAQ